MIDVVTLIDIEKLPTTTASDVKNQGWRAVTKRAHSQGIIAVTSHGEVDVVVLSRDMYVSIMGQLRKHQNSKAAELDALRKRFGERLASLRSGDAGDRLRAAMARPAALGGSVKAGNGY